MDDIMQRLLDYKRSYAIWARGHYLASARQAHRNYRLGVPSVVISAVVGTSIFGTIGSSPELGWRIAAGLFSISAAILASLQTFFRFAEYAERHLEAGRRYGQVRRKLEYLELKYRQADASRRDEALTDLAELYDALAMAEEKSPAVPDSCWKQAQREGEERNRR